MNTGFRADFEAWGALTDNIYIWDYNTNFSNYLLPVPNLRSRGGNIRYFVAAGVKGIMFEDAHALGSSFSDLRNYLTSRLLWNPALDDRQLFEEFLNLHYRSAAAPIRRYLDLLHDTAFAKNIERSFGGRAADYGIDRAVVRAGLEAFDEAMRRADDDLVRRRVEKASIAGLCAAVEPAWLWIQQHRDSLGEVAMDRELAQETRPHARRLFALCAEHHVGEWRPTVSIEDARRLFRQAYGLNERESF
jgi:hypothetical protein